MAARKEVTKIYFLCGSMQNMAVDHNIILFSGHIQNLIVQ